MKCLLRKIHFIRWPEKSPLTQEELDNLLTDLELDGGSKLSVYSVADDKDIEIAVIGLAGNKDELKKVEYILVEEEEIKDFTIEDEEGDTPCAQANLLHKNIIVSSEEDLLKLAKLIQEKGERDARSKNEIKLLLKTAYENGTLNYEEKHHKLHLEVEVSCTCDLG